MHRTQPVGAVATHPRQHHADGARAEHRGHGAEQRIGRRAHAPDGRGLVERDDRAVGGGGHSHMIIARRHVRRVGHEWRTLVGFHHLQRRHRVESLGEAPGELGRHVLHNQHSDAFARREPGHEVGERARAPSRGRDGDGQLRAEPQGGVRRVPHRGRGAGQHRYMGKVGREGRADGGDQARRQALQRRPGPVVRLGDDLDGA